MKEKQNDISLNRKIMQWEWYSDHNVFKMFIHCLMRANWLDYKWQGKVIKRGSFVTSYDKLSYETGLTVKQVRLTLDKLVSTNEIIKKTTNKYTIITVVKYDNYQVQSQTKGTQKALKGQTKGTQRATSNKDNNLNKENKGNKKTLSSHARVENPKCSVHDDRHRKSSWCLDNCDFIAECNVKKSSALKEQTKVIKKYEPDALDQVYYDWKEKRQRS